MTTFNEIIDLSYSTLYQNYKLDNLLKENENLFYKFLSNILLNSINMFNGVINNLSFHQERIINQDTLEETEIYVFDRTLTYKEIYILALGIAIGLYKRELDDVTIYSGHLSAKEFKEVGNAQNLKTRQARLIEMQEELDQEITAYQLHYVTEDGLNYFGGV